MSPQQIVILQILSGGILGVIGQSIRMIIGLKKWYEDKSINPGATPSFDLRRLLLSLFIGFIAGALGALIYKDPIDLRNKESLIAIIGIGYAGVDFIEGIMLKYISK
jgi:hypothetical protein